MLEFGTGFRVQILLNPLEVQDAGKEPARATGLHFIIPPSIYSLRLYKTATFAMHLKRQ